MLYEIYFYVVIIVEDVFGMFIFCCLVVEGGVGFDYWFFMVIFDMWIKFFKEYIDD